MMGVGQSRSKGAIMDKKAKKRLDVAHHKLQQLRQQLAGAKAQRDEPEEITRLEKEIAQLEAEVAKLKAS
jgi:cob(I)alamin adenosyltransferase